MSENRDLDKKTILCTSNSQKRNERQITVDVIKSAYICEPVTIQDLAERYKLPVSQIERHVQQGDWTSLRKEYAQKGLEMIQNEQLQQAEDLLDMERKFKQLRIVQIRQKLEEYYKYFARHGDLNRRDPISGEILHDNNKMPLQLKIPNLAREIEDLKKSVTLSEGMKKLVSFFDSLAPVKSETAEEKPIEVDYDKIFGIEDE